MKFRVDWIKFEYALAFCIVAAVLVDVAYLLSEQHLPQPFFYDPGDTWMDWFNTAFWAHNPGAYDAWATLYPPVSFLFLRFATLGRCYVANEGLYSRDCDWLGVIVLHAFYLLDIYLIGRTFLKIDRRTALPRSLALALGLPLMDALERGNLILVTFACFLLAHGPLLRSARMRWIMAGLTINFKVYLIGSIFAYPVKRRWRWFEGALLATIVIYLISWGWLGVGTPTEIYDNLVSFSANLNQAGGVLDVWYATSYQPLIGLLGGDNPLMVGFLGSWTLDFFSVFLAVLVHGAQALIVVATAMAWARPEAVPTYRLINLATCIALITNEPGGYTQCLPIFLTFFEPQRSGLLVRMATVCCYILSIPADIHIGPLLTQPATQFLSGGPFLYQFDLTYGPFVRPLFVLLIPSLLSCATIGAVWRDVRQQGWKGRGRFHRDFPLLLQGGRAGAPQDVAL